MVKNKDGTWNRTSPKCNWLELKEIMRWLTRTQPTLRPHEILSIAGLKINRLRRLKSTDLESQQHLFLWTEDTKQGLTASLCTCGQFEVSNIPKEKAKILHQNHVFWARKVGVVQPSVASA